MENRNYSETAGSSSGMPYLNSLANAHGLATNYYANGRESLPNYFMLTVGDTITSGAGFTGTVTEDNVVREFTKTDKTWKAYAEDLPYAGDISMSNSGLYVYIHNPFIFLCDVRGGCPTYNASQARNIVPFSQLASDISAGSLPNYIFIIPNNCHNTHDCSMSVGDDWLKSHVPALLNALQSDGIVVITFDESANSTINGGGHVETVIIGPSWLSKPSYRSTTFYQHQSVLRMMMKALAVFSYPNASARAPDMGEFFLVPLP
jgi:phosphatidylinositol-3-phosphatase